MATYSDETVQLILKEKQQAIDAIGQAITLIAKHAEVPNDAYDELRTAYAALHAAKARIEIELKKEQAYLGVV